ncbi:hypothetical protein GR927_38745 [Mycolicibacterium sp. 3033]|nr:hypothetical protein [Mycolicibacterium aurantiacum]
MAGPSISMATAAPNDGVALNGVYTVVSDGQMARTNERFRDEATVIARWTVSSDCTTFQDCTGRVDSDQGWTADITYLSNVWYVRRTLPNWEPCPDGTAAPGEQTYFFWRDPDDTAILTGWDETKGPSGACGINKQLVIKLPLRLTPA